MGSKIAPMGWMREIVVSDFFSPLVPGLSKTQPLTPPRVGKDREGLVGRGTALYLNFRSLNLCALKSLIPLLYGFSLLWKEQ